MFQRPQKPHRPRRVLLSLSVSTLLVLAVGCGASVHSGASNPSSPTSPATPRGIEYSQTIAADSGAGRARALLLRADRARYSVGQPIHLELVNRSTATYRSSGDCVTPTALWLRAVDGATYFVSSGASSVCGTGSGDIVPGQRATLAVVDSQMAWIDQSSDEKVFRLPRALPLGRYSVHALTSRGELTTSLEISR